MGTLCSFTIYWRHNWQTLKQRTSRLKNSIKEHFGLLAWEYTPDFTALLKTGAYSKAEKCVKYFVLKRVPRAETSKTDTYKRHLKGSHTRMIMASVRYCVTTTMLSFGFKILVSYLFEFRS